MPRKLGASGIILVAIALTALNLRTPLTALPPVITDVAADLEFTAATAGLLTGIPVLCFALTTPAAATLLSRISLRRGVGIALLLILIGTGIRSANVGALAVPGAFVGTVLIGLGITTANVAIPALTQRTFPGRISTVTGIYTAVLNVGTVTSTALTAQLADALGWRWAIASWGLMCVIALAWWRFAVLAEAAPDRAPLISEGTPSRSVLRDPFTWALCLMFALQAASFYGLAAWLPLILVELAEVSVQAAGPAAALFHGFAILGSIGASVAIHYAGPRISFAIIGLAWLSLPLTLLVAPGAWLIGISAAGMAQGGNFVLIFTMISRHFPDVARARKASATMQTAGYSLAAVSPSLLGGLSTLAGSWYVPVAVITAALTLMAIVGLTVITKQRT